VLRVIAVGSDLADEPERRRLVAALTTLAGKAPGSLGECESVLDPVGEEVRLAEIHQEERLGNSVPHSLAGAHRVRPQRGRTLFAELRPSRILVLAPGTLRLRGLQWLGPSVGAGRR